MDTFLAVKQKVCKLNEYKISVEKQLVVMPGHGVAELLD